MMDPIIDSEWLDNKNEQVEEPQNIGNVALSWQWRERGIDPPYSPSNKTVLENVAEDVLVQKNLNIRCCDLPGYPRSTFLMVFSPDGTKVASTHGNHNVYISELASGKHVRILKGHPRTPWCIAFHPSHPELIGSGCLGGQVRVWDIASGGSEVWSAQKETVIASIAFHPREQLLVIATYNELYFWDWSQQAPFAKVSTNNVNEKVRYVAFDSLGHKLITGISIWTSPGGHTSVLQGNLNSPSPTNLISFLRGDDLDDTPERNRMPESPASTRDTDRGTDPMETDPSPETSYTHSASASLIQSDNDTPTPNTSRTQDNQDNDDLEIESNNTPLLNLDVLSFESGPSRVPSSAATSVSEAPTFGSESSAFIRRQSDALEQISSRLRRRRSDTSEQSDGIPSRLLPNPFSSTNSGQRIHRFTVFNRSDEESAMGSSRTSLFPFLNRSESPVLDVSSDRNTRNTYASTQSDPPPTNSSNRLLDVPSPQNTPSASVSTTPASTSSSTPSQPSTPGDTQSINESLDLIRDILRDSGTRLLNLITNMSLSTLDRADRDAQRDDSSRAQSNDRESASRARYDRARQRLFNAGLNHISSSSESDSDNPPEVNIFRTRNTTFRADRPRDQSRTAAASGSRSPGLGPLEPSQRLLIDLYEHLQMNDNNGEQGNVSVSSNSNRFHVRTQSSTGDDSASTRGTDTPTQNNSSPSQANQSSNFDPNLPSTSRDPFWATGNIMSSEEAYRKVRGGVNALHRHAQQLTNFWVRGHRISMRDLRNMWENLRRRVLMIHRDNGRQEVQSHYSRSLLERCMMLSDMSDNSGRSSSRTRGSQRSQMRNSEAGASSTNTNSETPENLNTTPETTSGNTQARRSTQTRSGGRYSPILRRRFMPNHRWRQDDDLRRRHRHSSTNRLLSRSSNRPRREFERAIEISATRHEIRMRAMQVLSVMFNRMMMCLEEQGLSQLIINMLRTLKKALAVTCLMLMSYRNNNNENSGNNQSATPESTVSNRSERNGNQSTSEAPKQTESAATGTPEDANRASSSTPVSNPNQNQQDSPALSSTNSTQRWSNRLAVLIAAANRNTSATARSRRELYIEYKKIKALHRTNPTAHPLIKKKMPPVSAHRIPALRSLPRRNIVTVNPNSSDSPIDEPIAGPSNSIPREGPTYDSRLPPEVMNEFEHRINLLRIAHMQAVRLRNMARSRYRRLQTIRFYTPSSVREMFTLQDLNNQHDNQSPPQNNSEPISRRQFYSMDNRLPIFRREYVVSRVSGTLEDPGELLQVNDLNNAEGQRNQQQRLPRIHEYLQPIIYAQNVVVDEDANEAGGNAGAPGAGGDGVAGAGGGPRRMGGMAGLLDAGIISENYTVSSHRVQAWDFTKGETPDIADTSKNVVVQRCRIHNDASIDISKDGRLLVALMPVPRLRNTNHWLGVYSLEWSRLGQCLHTAMLEQSAVSVALSPTARHLAVGLGSRRFTSVHHARSNVFALLYRLDPLANPSRTGLAPIKELEQNWERGFTSLNCLRWAPQPGQGLVYANNTGQLIIMS
ncbi:activating molecule in BECN1-regulated autophagy protein 1-like [Leptidea sinapis]|uniref:activating molecule in BECN1-regulated autophagy protein 1-like n=1 Tax=Leptidea sinapis TaxID=189913 RepID=UPI0021C4703D|nr:activating molecule in BECN1-regulated autophagy protein 1-like [Leptidea sinapis]